MSTFWYTLYGWYAIVVWPPGGGEAVPYEGDGTGSLRPGYAGGGGMRSSSGTSDGGPSARVFAGEAGESSGRIMTRGAQAAVAQDGECTEQVSERKRADGGPGPSETVCMLPWTIEQMLGG